jgi:TetR/AcrR family transcriptional regulator, transcriptional repressor for nem operon
MRYGACRVVSEMTDSESRVAGGPRPGKRERLVAAAGQLVHEQGIERTTLAEIAKAADVPAGNVYYYFKTKDDVIAAVIESHARQTKAALAVIEQRYRSPKDRLKALVAEFISQSDIIARYGCPLGSLCSELDKRVSEPGLPAAELMRVPIEWAETQFKSLGREDAQDLAFDLLAAYEGSALLANTMRDPEVLISAARRIDRWIDAL